MSEEWLNVPLSELVERVTTRNLIGVDRVFSVSAQHGLVDQETFFSKRVASKNLEGYWVVNPGDYVFNKSYSDGYPLGVVARNLASTPGVVSPLYIVMRLKSDRLIDGWLDMAFLSSEYAASLQGLMKEGGRAHGALNVKLSDYFKAVIPVPPLAVQRRIVDLMAHLDNHLENLKAEIEAGARLEARFLERLLGLVGSVQMLALGDVGEFIRGRRFTKADYVPFGLGCIHYGQVHTHFGPIATEVLTYVPAEMQSRLRLAHAGDVVIAATSEDLSGLGKATAWLGDSDVAVHDDCYIFRHSLDPKYATYALASPWFQSQKAQFGDGMKVARISSSDLAKIQIPVPPRETQIRVGEAMASLTSKSEAMRAEVASLATLRQCLLSLLLSGQVQIPAEFDELLAEVA